MKKSLSIFLSACVMWVMTFQTACLGSFNLTHSYWDWNSGIGRWPGAVFFFILGGIITGVTLFVDVVILNLIEFWSGDNPMSMQEGDMDQQLVMGQDGNSYEITATKNRFDIVQLSGDKAGEIQSLIYDPETKSWSHKKGCDVNTVFQYSENGEFISVYATDGRVATIPSGISDKNTAAAMLNRQFASQTCMN